MKHPELNYASPVAFTFKQRVILRVVPPLMANAFKLVLASGRWDVRGEERLTQAMRAHGRVVIGVWHECVALAAWHLRNSGFHSMASYSFDGELGVRVAERFGVEAVRGSSSRGGQEGLGQLRKALDRNITIGLTLDGPKGPRRIAKFGAATLSTEAGLPVVPMACAASPAWRMRSWDRFLVPKPFARAIILFGAPIAPPADPTREAIETHRQHIQNYLNGLQQEIELEIQGRTLTPN